MIDFSNSKIDAVSFGSKRLFVKRDDLIHPIFNGNKARKLYFLINSAYRKIITYGGSNSNTIAPLSFIAAQKNMRVDFYVKTFAKAQDLSALPANINFIEITPARWEQTVQDLRARGAGAKDEIFIPQGVAMQEAGLGVKILAAEIAAARASFKFSCVFLPSGTGTTAFYLQNFLQDLDVYTTPCVGDEKYLQEQFSALGKGRRPRVIAVGKYRFGAPHKDLLNMYRDLLSQTGIEFDLLYDPIGFLALQKLQKNDVLYIHQGGTSGNKTMLKRYEFAFGS
ncbi:MAG: 1-aminocyclopropane-1-carboxylate deaminase [Helicobacteraceae bacterium]